ncbi:aldo/keto reductase [Amylibacter sp.]|nr:aldo/keto reductase [Amylibacter sp.]
MANHESKLVLGSANFGLDYGLSNNSGKISESELIKIFNEASASRVNIIDTAQAYGDSEVRIGSHNASNINIITKINIGCRSNNSRKSVIRQVEESCERLKCRNLYAVMLHRPEVLLDDCGPRIISELLSLKEDLITTKIGVSIYSPDILEEISKLVKFDIIQAPFNIFDQRILTSGWADRLKENGTEIHTRSVFLQGLLLMRESNLPKYFSNNWPNLFNSWFEFLKSSRNDALTTSLDFVLQQPWIDNTVVGVDSAIQLKSLVNIENISDTQCYPQLNCGDENLIDPSKWKLI